jgi:hypothetical protein
LVPPQLERALHCSGLRYVMVETFFSHLSIPRSGTAGNYSAQQVRAMVDGVDRIVERLCSQVTPIALQERRIDINSYSEKAWQPLLVDEKAMQWVRENSALLAELEPISLYMSFGSKLYPSTGADAPPAPSTELDTVEAGVGATSLTDDERAARMGLYLFGKSPRLATILPSRFDIARLARLEEASRTQGVPILRRYRVDLASERPDFKKARDLLETEKRAIWQAQHDATESLEVLARQFALPYADRYK